MIYEAYNGSITKSRALDYAFNYMAYIKKELRKENPEGGVYNPFCCRQNGAYTFLFNLEQQVVYKKYNSL